MEGFLFALGAVGAVGLQPRIRGVRSQ